MTRRSICNGHPASEVNEINYLRSIKNANFRPFELRTRDAGLSRRIEKFEMLLPELIDWRQRGDQGSVVDFAKLAEGNKEGNSVSGSHEMQ